MTTPPDFKPRTRPDPLPTASSDLDFDWRTELRLFAELWLFVGREAGRGFAQIGRSLADLWRAARNPATSRETLIGVSRALAQANILYGVILLVVMPLAGAGERAWQFILTITVLSMAIEMILAGNWFGGAFKTVPAKKVSLVKAPRP